MPNSGSQKSLGHQPSPSSQEQNPNFDSNVISERVKHLATQIYQELKRIISRCNYDEDILSGLMPLIVRVLESLDLALIENQQLQVELELCKDDNDQLVIMFEKEKTAKRAIDKKLIESEYSYEEERQQYQHKIESLDSTVKMYELKAKNASDQAARFEEKEAERKKEYNQLHDRYTDLLKSHCDVVERYRHLAGNNEVANVGTVNVPLQMVATNPEMDVGDLQSHNLSRVTKLKADDTDSDKVTIKSRDTFRSWNAETELTLEDASLVVIDDEAHRVGDGSSHNESDRVLSEPEADHEKEGENDSVAYTSMEKEFRKLIRENKDLLNTKNALNVVKDDLIAEVDRLSNEVAMYEQDIQQLNSTKDQMKQKVSALDAELRKTKEELEKAKHKIRENNEDGVPYSLRKRFGRAEMAKVLMERNSYKEKLMELQDAMKYAEFARANKLETEKRSGLWKFFSNLFGATLAIGPATTTPRNLSPVVSYHGSGGATIPYDSTVASEALQTSVRGGSLRPSNQRLSSNSDLIVLMDSDLNIDRSRAFKDGTSRSYSDMPNYIHAYGWSLPASSVRSMSGGGEHDAGPILGGTSSHVTDLLPQADCNVSFNKVSGLQVPIPLYCRPLTGDSLGMKIWCATSIDISGGDLTAIAKFRQPGKRVQIESPVRRDTDSSGSIVNISTSTPAKPSHQALKKLEQDVDKAMAGDQGADVIDAAEHIPSTSTQRPILKTTTEMVLSALPVSDDAEDLSTCVWICSTQHSRSKITIIDIKMKPNELLDSFYVHTFLYCIKSIPGCKPGDLLGIIAKSECATKNSASINMIKELIANQKSNIYQLIEVDLEAEYKLRKVRLSKQPETEVESNQQTEGSKEPADSKSTINEDDAEISRILDNNTSVGIATLQKLNDFVAHTQPQADPDCNTSSSDHQLPDNSATDPDNQDNEECQSPVYYQPISTHLSTVWMGGKDSILYVHSAIGQWKDCVACVKLPDSILQICHYRGRVFVALANGKLCVFFRNCLTRQWEFSHYLLIDIDLLVESPEPLSEEHTNSDFPDTQPRPSFSDSATLQQSIAEQINEAGPPEIEHDATGLSSTPTKGAKARGAGIRCLEITNKNLWIGYRNRIVIIDPITLNFKHMIRVIPQIDNQIRQIKSMKDGVFCCLRSDMILRLYSSLKPYQHIQNIDIEPIVTRLITPKTFVVSHITAMKVVGNTLWIGNAHGIILMVPCKLVPQVSESSSDNPSDELEESTNSSLSIARYVPQCDINNAQISFHGHKDAVKFLINAHSLMLSGGQGYLDFRIDMDDQSKSISDKSHLILWSLVNNQ